MSACALCYIEHINNFMNTITSTQMFHFEVVIFLVFLQPVVFLHGGPGGGTTPSNRRFFDPDHYRIILFDQVTFSLFFDNMSFLSPSNLVIYPLFREVQEGVHLMLAWNKIQHGISSMT